jgi:hypothetical protein
MSPRFQRSAFDTRFVWWNLMNVSSPDRFEEEERRRITQLLSKMNGSQAKVARMLGLTRSGRSRPPTPPGAASALVRFWRFISRGRRPSSER